VVLVQQSRDSTFYDRDTPIWLSLLWQSYTPVSVSTLKPLLEIIETILLKPQCYDLSFELSEKHTLVLSNIRKLDRVPKYKTSTLYTNYWWSILHFFSSILMTIYLLWGWHVLTMLYDIIISRTFYVVPSHYISMWLMCDCDMWHHVFVFFA